VRSSFREVGFAGDLAWDRGPFRLRLEWVGNLIEYDQGKRPRTASGGFLPDDFRWNSYLITAYRTGFHGVEPYVYIEYARRRSVYGDAFSIASAGVNVHVSSASQIKLQYARINQYTDGQGIQDGFHTLDSRWVMAF
jgi:hypothetical protein